MQIRKTTLTQAALSLSLLAAAATATAAIQGAGVNNASPAENGTELIFIAYSPSLESSYVLDLGVTIADFKANGSSDAGFSFSRTVTSAYAPLAAANDVRWAVAAFDTYTANDALLSGDLQLLTTVANPSAFSPAAPGMTGLQLSNAALPWQNYTNFVNNLPGHVGPANANGSSYSVKADGAAYALDPFSININLNNNFGYSQFNPVGTSSRFASLTACPADECLFDGTLNVQARVFSNAGGNGAFSFDGSNLAFSLSPVPEPGTYALMALGLVAIGARIGRRQQG